MKRHSSRAICTTCTSTIAKPRGGKSKSRHERQRSGRLQGNRAWHRWRRRLSRTAIRKRRASRPACSRNRSQGPHPHQCRDRSPCCQNQRTLKSILNERLSLGQVLREWSGGQHVNKTESAVRLTHYETGIVVQCQDEKSQHKNIAKALRQLKTKLYEHKRAENDAKTGCQS